MLNIYHYIFNSIKDNIIIEIVELSAFIISFNIILRLIIYFKEIKRLIISGDESGYESDGTVKSTNNTNNNRFNQSGHSNNYFIVFLLIYLIYLLVSIEVTDITALMSSCFFVQTSSLRVNKYNKINQSRLKSFCIVQPSSKRKYSTSTVD